MRGMLEHPEIGWIERTGHPSWLQDEDGYDDDCRDDDFDLEDYYEGE